MLEPLTPDADPRPAQRAGRRDTSEAILSCAEELLQRRGFGGFAYQHIAVQLGIRNAAIHYHFPVKEDLGVALVRRYRLRFREWIEGLPRHADAWSQLQAYFTTYTGYLADPAIPGDCRLCPAGALAAEFGALPEAMQLEVRLLMRDMQDWLRHTLDEGRRACVLCFDGDPLDKAVEVGALLQGGLQIARVSGSKRFHRLVEQLAADLRPAAIV